jgi:hypothetical protein
VWDKLSRYCEQIPKRLCGLSAAHPPLTIVQAKMATLCSVSVCDGKAQSFKQRPPSLPCDHSGTFDRRAQDGNPFITVGRGEFQAWCDHLTRNEAWGTAESAPDRTSYGHYGEKASYPDRRCKTSLMTCRSKTACCLSSQRSMPSLPINSVWPASHASSTSSTALGRSRSLNHTMRAGTSRSVTPARSRLRRSEMARIRSLRPARRTWANFFRRYSGRQ